MPRVTKFNNILLTGVPRSGTTWASHVLGLSPGTTLIHEPDNEINNVPGFFAKHQLHRMPYLTADMNLTGYSNFWRLIFDGCSFPKNLRLNTLYLLVMDFSRNLIGKDIFFRYMSYTYLLRGINSKDTAAPVRVIPQKHGAQNSKIIKSVHAGLSLSYLDAHFHPKILLLFRHPASVVSSYLRLNMPDRDRKVYLQEALVDDYLLPYLPKIQELQEPLSFMGLQVAIFYYVWEQLLKSHTHWISISHEDLCEHPIERYQELYSKLNLIWCKSVEDYLHQHNRQGSGYAINRVASKEINKWRNELSSAQINSIRKGYSILQVQHYNDFQFEN